MMQSNQQMAEGDRGCGLRLRRAREAAGLTVAEVGARLKMPVRVVESLEAEDWGRLGAPVFVRGQLRSYSRLLGLLTEPMFVASGVAAVTPSELKPRTYTPRMQRLGEQVARRLVYIVLTAAIVVPVWLATRPHLGNVAGNATPLDAPVGTRSIGDAGNARASDDTRPLIASLAPMPPSPAAAPAITLQLAGESWVEVSARDGRVLESSLLPAGTQRSYAAGEISRIVLGNAGAVRVQRNGQVQDLSAFQRANVVRFTVSSDGSLAPAAD